MIQFNLAVKIEIYLEWHGRVLRRKHKSCPGDTNQFVMLDALV